MRLGLRRAAFASVALAIGGCSQHQDSGSTPGGGAAGTTEAAPIGQAAVRVNDDVITAEQVAAQLRGAPSNLTAEQKSAATGQATWNLVNQQLLEEQALSAGLDRDPGVVEQIETARKQILSQAYLQKRVYSSDRPADKDVRDYYAANPALFAERRIYDLHELDVPAISAAQSKELTDQVSRAKNPNDITAWLNTNHIAFKGNDAVRAAEQLPLALLPKIAAMRDGQIGVLQGDGRATVILRGRSQSQPVSFDAARPAIERFLAKNDNDARARAELQRLRQSAKLEFLGDYAKYRDAANAAPAKPTEEPPAAPDPGTTAH